MAKLKLASNGNGFYSCDHPAFAGPAIVYRRCGGVAMAYHYTDPSRESNPHALPDVEVFYQSVPGRLVGDVPNDEPLCEPGWYFAFGFPGAASGTPSRKDPSPPRKEALTAARDAAGME